MHNYNGTRFREPPNMHVASGWPCVTGKLRKQLSSMPPQLLGIPGLSGKNFSVQILKCLKHLLQVALEFSFGYLFRTWWQITSQISAHPLSQIQAPSNLFRVSQPCCSLDYVTTCYQHVWSTELLHLCRQIHNVPWINTSERNLFTEWILAWDVLRDPHLDQSLPGHQVDFVIACPHQTPSSLNERASTSKLVQTEALLMRDCHVYMMYMDLVTNASMYVLSLLYLGDHAILACSPPALVINARESSLHLQVGQLL